MESNNNISVVPKACLAVPKLPKMNITGLIHAEKTNECAKMVNLLSPATLSWQLHGVSATGSEINPIFAFF